MKYLLNITLLSTLLLFTIACNEEQFIVDQDSELLTTDLDLKNTPVQGNEPHFGHANPELIFKILDTDEDGKISMIEAEKAKRKRLLEKFDFIDTNKDGFIDRQETEKLLILIQSARQGKPNPEQIIKVLDTDKDGKITREEAEKAKKGKLEENFDLVDTNKDGYIDKQELENLSNMAQSVRAGMPNPKQIFKILDLNNDGKISRIEAEKVKKRKLAENFDLIDINIDGFIEIAELISFSNNTRIDKN